MSLRTNTFRSGHDFCPNESGALGLQRYGAPKVEGQNGIVAIFPNGPRPLAPLGTYAPGTISTPRADGVERAWGWGISNPLSYLWGNVGYVDSSPFGQSIRFVQATVNNANRGFSYRISLTPGVFNPAFFYPTSSLTANYVLFCIARDESVNGWNRYITAIQKAGQTYSYGRRATDGKIYVDGSGTVNSSGSVAYTARPDGWIFAAFHHQPTSLTTGTLDIWVNGALCGSGLSVALCHPQGINVVTVGGEPTNKDGLSWQGQIAQVAFFIAGSAGIASATIARWFADPWWMRKHERYHAWAPGHGFAEFDLQGSGEVEGLFLGGAPSLASLIGAPEVDAAGEPEGGAVDGLLCGGRAAAGSLEGVSDD